MRKTTTYPDGRVEVLEGTCEEFAVLEGRLPSIHRWTGPPGWVPLPVYEPPAPSIGTPDAVPIVSPLIIGPILTTC